jgi:hypothetical protein
MRPFTEDERTTIINTMEAAKRDKERGKASLNVPLTNELYIKMCQALVGVGESYSNRATSLITGSDIKSGAGHAVHDQPRVR